MSNPYTLSFPEKSGQIALINDIPKGSRRVKDRNNQEVSLTINSHQCYLYLDGYGNYTAIYQYRDDAALEDSIYTYYASYTESKRNPSTTTDIVYFITVTAPFASVTSISYTYNTTSGPFGKGK